MNRTEANAARFLPEQETPHYESWFLRANHPTEPRAFWLRYTIFAPARFSERVGELWAVVFDGSRRAHTAVRTEVPLARTRFSTSGLGVTIGEATLEDGEAQGHAHHAGRSIRWHLGWEGGHEPLLLLPERLYRTSLLPAKSVVARPSVAFHGTIEVDGHVLHVDGWRGSQNHHWGREHPHAYAWGQVVGFDGEGDVFLECVSAKLRLGPVVTPALTALVLREGERETQLQRISTATRSRASFAPFSWELESREGDVLVSARFDAPASSFVGLRYLSPKGGCKICLGTKIAACRLDITHRGEPARHYQTAHRAAFELLSDEATGGIELSA